MNGDSMNRLRDLREDKDLKQIQLANMLDISQTTYSRYETEELNIPVETLIKLAIYYNTSIDYLVGITNERVAYKRINKVNSK